MPRQGGPLRGKLCAFREKDRNFVATLLDVELVDGDVIVTRLGLVPDKHQIVTERRSLGWRPGFPTETQPQVIRHA